ncbi:hydrogenase [Azospirillum halopraeferens]|uniref:hydrogenase n=1 Tax=Azospirillum halopraeferens TaxID=34010 RepID=UPI001FDF1601|nr:hydrogenase [Azospirillum halopraeferens]
MAATVAAAPPALPAAVGRLVRDLGYPLLEADDAPWRDDSAPWVVFLPGHGRGNAETADIAVILPELLATVGGALRPAVAGAAAERALVERAGGLALPALMILRGDAVLDSIPRVRDWGDYRARIAAILR